MNTQILEKVVTTYCNTTKLLSAKFSKIPTYLLKEATQQAVYLYLEKAPAHVKNDFNKSCGYIYRTAYRELIRLIRYESRHTTLLLQYLQDDTCSDSKDIDYFHPLVIENFNHIEVDLIQKSLLKTLSKKLADVWQLHTEGYSTEEIAVLIGSQPDAVRKRLQRARNILKDLWNE